jgi:hypothetical protein
MEALRMNNDTSKPSSGIVLNDAALAQVRRSAELDRRRAEDDALNRIQPSNDRDSDPSPSKRIQQSSVACIEGA